MGVGIPVELELSGDYYDREGNSITMSEYAEKHQDMSYKVVARTNTSYGDVSTVWLGINHAFMGEGPPVIFETMIFIRRFRMART